MKCPEFIFIGPDKSGSTWIHDVLTWHPDIYVAPSKELEFFDRYYHRGLDWYLGYFQDAGRNHRVIGEVCHSYLFSVEACARIQQNFPKMKLLVCLREPVARAFSSYLYMIKQGRLSCSFAEAVDDVEELIDHGYYARHLQPYIEQFGKEHIYVAIFDDLQSDPTMFAGAMFSFLGVDVLDLPEELCGKSLPASHPRSLMAAKFAKRSALLIRALGLPGIVSKIKGLPLMQQILYKQYDQGKKPTPDIQTITRLRLAFAGDVRQLDEYFGLGLAAKWDYE